MASAKGVDKELQLAKEERKRYYLLNAYNDSFARRPSSASPYETIYDWTWNNLKYLLRK